MFLSFHELFVLKGRVTIPGLVILETTLNLVMLLVVLFELVLDLFVKALSVLGVIALGLFVSFTSYIQKLVHVVLIFVKLSLDLIDFPVHSEEKILDSPFMGLVELYKLVL